MSLFFADEIVKYKGLTGIYQENIIEKIIETIKGHDKKKPILVLDDNVIETKAGGEIVAALRQEFSLADYSGFPLPPSLDEVKEGACIYLQEECDCIIAIGGGSTIDLAKMIGLLACNNHPWKEFFYNPMAGRTIPLLLVVPTSLTGGESSETAYSLDFSGPLIRCIGREYFVPPYVFLDENLLLSLPENILVADLMDLFCHILELYTRGEDVEEFLEVWGANFREGIDKDIEGLKNLQNLSLDIGKVYNAEGYGFLQGLAHVLTSYTELHHGTVVAYFMPTYLRMEFDKYELDAIANTCGWTNGEEMLLELEGLTERFKDDFTEVLPLIEENLVLISGQAALSVPAREDKRGIDIAEMDFFIKEALEIE